MCSRNFVTQHESFICSEYARPHAGFSPGRAAALGLPPQCIDPMLHYQLNSMYGPRDRSV